MVNSLCLILITLISVSCGPQVGAQVKSKHSLNSVAAYLENAEIRAETDEQRQEIHRALSDMLKKPTAELRTRRYADYQGTPNMWSITQLLTAYFVPQTPQSLESKRFYKDVGKPEAKLAIHRQLDEINRALNKSGP